MRFGDRIRCSTAKLSRERWKKYWDYLDELGFSKNDPLYRLFGGEVFHDGEISIDQIGLTDGAVVLQLRNVHAVDEVDQLLRSRKGRVPKLNRADFRTKVTFRGVKRLEINFRNTPHDELYYHCAELDRKQEYVIIKIYFTNFDERPGWIKLIFKSIEVEDIGKRIRRYLPLDVRVDDIISYVKEGYER